MIETINPATGRQIQAYEEDSPERIAKILADARAASQSWARFETGKRVEILVAAAAILDASKDEYARLMSLEMGKPIAQGREEIAKCAWVCRYYSENARKFLGPELVETDAGKSYVAYEPLGTLLAVMPWNFPFWQVFRAAAPALAAGNVLILKHASNVSGCARAIEEIFASAGAPAGVFQSVIIGNNTVGDLISHSDVHAVTLTGSVRAGRSVGSKAGEALKKSVLELGGSDPYIILEDADLKEAAAACAYSRLINSGQSCIAAKRFVVVESVKKEFEEIFVEEMRKSKMGDPQEEETTIGPLAREDLRDELHRQVEESIAKGAKLLCGGEIPEREGAYYPPTVLTDVRKGMPAYEEETFGPVAAIISAKNEEDAIRIANDSVFGLGSAVFTRDTARGERIARFEIRAGSCFVNTFVHSDPRLPFGGIKESGYGRELGPLGMREFLNIKTVYIK